MTAHLALSIKAPVDCTPEQLREWIMYELKQTDSIDTSNPLVDFELDFEYVEIQELKI